MLILQAAFDAGALVVWGEGPVRPERSPSRSPFDPDGERLRDSLRREVELARAWSSCALRCASLRFPETARIVKPLLGIEPDEVGAVPVRPRAHVRVDRGRHAVPPPPAEGHHVLDEHAGQSRAGDTVGVR